ncbi:MAG: hypothetical protein FWD79_12590 [Desulfobulbus sp.]|nr:hypothetical protein [Desulfobulbus sp.]
MVTRTDSILIGWKEISVFCGMSENALRSIVQRYESVPINNDGRVFAERETLNAWLRLYARGQAVKKLSASITPD